MRSRGLVGANGGQRYPKCSRGSRLELTVSDGLGDTESTGSVKLFGGLGVQDRPALHLTGQFTESLQRVEQHGNEKNTSTGESTGRRLGQVVETTSGNKGDSDAVGVEF